MFIILMLALFLYACGAANKIKKSVDKDDVYVANPRLEKKYFFPMFKMDVFLHSVQLGFNDSPEIRKVLQEDKSGGALGEAVIDPEDALSVARMITARIKRDSALNLREAPSDLRGKAVFQFCLDFYNSKELDSITNHLYKTKYSKPNILKPIK